MKRIELTASTFRRRRRYGLTMACLAAWGTGLAEAAPRLIDARLDRDFGLVVGSVLIQTVRVEADAGESMETASLPAPGSALNDWLEIRNTAWRSDQEHGHRVFRIDIEYQVFKGVREPESLEIPALSLSLKTAGGPLTLQVPPLPFTLTPLIPPNQTDEGVTIRPLRPSPDVPVSQHGTWLFIWLLGLAVAMTYGAWRRGLSPFRRDAQPFAAAGRELRRLRRRAGAPPDPCEAMRIFHGALNRYAGRVVLESHLPDLFVEFPELAGVRSDLEALFQRSHRLFFVPHSGEAGHDFSLSSLEALCRRCRSLEVRRP